MSTSSQKKWGAFAPYTAAFLHSCTLILLYFLSKPLILLGWRKSLQSLPARHALHSYSYQRLALRTRLPQCRHRTQRLRIHPSHQVRIVRSILLPQLPNLYFGNTGSHPFDFIAPSQTCQSSVPRRFPSSSRPSPTSYRDRHRGSGHPLSPATPPDMRVRIRRFGGLS